MLPSLSPSPSLCFEQQQEQCRLDEERVKPPATTIQPDRQADGQKKTAAAADLFRVVGVPVVWVAARVGSLAS